MLALVEICAVHWGHVRLLFCCGALYSLLPLNIRAQTLDSANAVHIWSYYRLSSEVAGPESSRRTEDSSLQFLHLLHPGKARMAGWLDLGQIGTPILDVWNTGISWNERLENGVNPLGNYIYQTSATRYYSGVQPRSDLSYAQGTGDLIYLKAEHAQNIFSRWLFGLDYTRIKSNNLYYGNLRDFTKIRIPNHYYTRLYSHFFTQNLKYEVFTSLVWNKSKIAETGGVADPGRFDTLVGRDKFYFNEARLQDAENALILSNWQVTQYYRTGDRRVREGDTFRADTLRSSITGQWFHRLDLYWDRSVYSDPDASESYYPQIYYQASTHDSIRVFNTINRLGYEQFGTSGSWQRQLWLEHEFVRVGQFPGHSAVYNNIRAGASAGMAAGLGRFKVNGTFVPLGFFAGDYRITASYTRSLSLLQAGVEIVSQLSEPDFNTQFFAGNHYYWHNNLNKTGYQSLKLNLAGDSLTRFKPGFFLQSEWYRGLVYFDTSSAPVQVEEGFGRLRAGANWHWQMGRRWHYEQELGWQKTAVYLRIPEWVLKTRFYWEGHVFKQNMLLRAGGDLYYMSAFGGMSYNPVIRRFHWDDSRQSGGYPVLDLFINAKVQSMHLFVHWQHVSDGMFGYDFYSANAYPLLYRSFRFGLKWRLFN